MATKIIRTVIGGNVIETPVEVPDSEVKEAPKTKRGRPSKSSKTEKEATDESVATPPAE